MMYLKPSITLDIDTTGIIDTIEYIDIMVVIDTIDLPIIRSQILELAALVIDSRNIY